MLPASTSSPLVRWGVGTVALAVASIFGGCASEPQARQQTFLATALSPSVEWVAPRAAWRQAEAYVRDHPGCEVMVGRGDSMLPLYRDGTVIVVQAVPTADLRCSMTAVFIGDHGRPVAHVLTEKTARGWRARGAGNREQDATFVRFDNLIGIVVRAYATQSTDGLLVRDTPSVSDGWPASGVVAPDTRELLALTGPTPLARAQ